MKRLWTIVGLCWATGLGLMGGDAAWAAEPPAGQPQQIDFRFKFETGRTVRQRLVSKTVGDLKLLGPMKFQQTFEQQLLTRCRKVNTDGSAVLDLTLEAVALRQSMGPMTLEFDSRTWKPGQSGNPALEFLGKLFSAMAGTTFTLNVDANGEPTKVEGLSEAMKKALEQMGDDKEAQVLRKMFEDMISGLGDDNIMQQFRSFGRLAPPKPGLVKVGEKWDHDWSMKSLPLVAGGLEGKGEYELLGIQRLNGRQCVKVRVKESFKMTPPDPQAPKPAADSPLGALFSRVKMELSSSGGDGIAYIDAQTGDVINLRQTQNIELKLSATADPQDPDENTRDGIQPMSMKFRVSVSVDTIDGAADPAGKAETKPATEEKGEK